MLYIQRFARQYLWHPLALAYSAGTVTQDRPLLWPFGLANRVKKATSQGITCHSSRLVRRRLPCKKLLKTSTLDVGPQL